MFRMRRLAPVLAFLALAPAAHAGTPLPGYSDTVAVSGLTFPTAVAFLPDGRMLVTQKNGKLLLHDGTATTTLTTIPSCTNLGFGTLGVAPDPGFGSNGLVYLNRTKAGAGGCGTATGRFNQIVRLKIVGSGVEPGSLTVLLTGIRTDGGDHNGGTLRIGPDQKLYVSTGDTGLGDDPGPPGSSTNPYAQDLGALEGKVLRLELDGSPAAGNPFVNEPGARDEIYALGFRNPFRFSFDPETDALWLGDVGQDALEEVDNVVSGGNYAWPHCEGTLPEGCQQPGDDDPVFTYPLEGPGSLGRSITGGAFAGTEFGSFADDYFFGDFIANKLYRVSPNLAHNGIVDTPSDFVVDAIRPVDIIFGPDGALYYVSHMAGQVRRVFPSCQGVPASIVGSAGNDILTGTAGSDVIVGHGGNDTISGLGGNDKICAGDGNDNVTGGAGSDSLNGDGGADTLDGGSGADVLSGLAGIDSATYASRTAGVTVDIDNVGDDGNSADGPAGTRDNVKPDVENLIGGSGADTLTGSAAANTLNGGNGADALSGLAGIDSATYASRAAGVTVDIDNVADDGNSADGPTGTRDNVKPDVENLVGGKGADTLVGSALNNRLTGGLGADTIRGLTGNDNLFANDGLVDAEINCDGGAADIAHVNGGDPATIGCETVGP